MAALSLAAQLLARSPRAAFRQRRLCKILGAEGQVDHQMFKGTGQERKHDSSAVPSRLLCPLISEEEAQARSPLPAPRHLRPPPVVLEPESRVGITVTKEMESGTGIETMLLCRILTEAEELPATDPPRSRALV